MTKSAQQAAPSIAIGTLTPAKIKALKWFRAVGDVSLFGIEAPSMTIRKRLEREGLIERCGLARNIMVKYRISQAGRDALAQQ